MPTSSVWVAESPEPTFAADAPCARCGRVGTVGFVARGVGVLTVDARYCFRCWPVARRAAQAEWRRERDAMSAAIGAWARAGGPTSGLPTPELQAPAGMALQTGWRGAAAEILYRLGFRPAG